VAHPAELLGELLRCAAGLGTFALDFKVADLPSYRPEDAAPGFRTLEGLILELLELAAPIRPQTFGLRRRSIPNVFTAEIPAEVDVFDGFDWILAVQAPLDRSLGAQEVEAKLKFASMRTLPRLVRPGGLSGLDIEHLFPAPHPLLSGSGTLHFRVRLEGVLWDTIRAERTVAAWVPESFRADGIQLHVLPRT